MLLLFQTGLCLLHQTLQLLGYQLYPPQVLTSTLTQLNSKQP